MVRSPTQAESEGTKCKRPLSGPGRLSGVTKGVADLTGLLQAWSRGDAKALEQLAPLVHLELRGVARRMLSRERQADGWQPTDLVQESYVRLLDWRVVRWQNRAHFFATAARMMRRVLVDAARTRHAQKRGGEAISVTFTESLEVASEPALDVLALDDALSVLAKIDKRKSRVIELRFFGGLSIEETSAVLGVSGDTVRRDWRLAKAWLKRELDQRHPR